MDTDTVIESLAAKLAAADLDDNETELLRTLIADPGEVEGFAAAGWTDVVRVGASTKGWSWGETNMGAVARPLGGNDDGSFVVGKPLGGDDDGSW
jgi:hypothetical protein